MSQTQRPDAEDELDDMPVSKAFTQDEVNQLIRVRLERYKKKTEAYYSAQLEELQALQGEVPNLRKLKEAQEVQAKKALEERRKDLPAHITSLLDKLSLEDQAKWLEENRDQLQEKPRAGLPDPPKGKTGTQPSEDELMAQKMRHINYGL